MMPLVELIRVKCRIMVWSGLVWSGLVWSGLVWSIIGDKAKFVKSFLLNFSRIIAQNFSAYVLLPALSLSRAG